MIPFSELVLSCYYIFEILFLPFHQRIPWKRTMVDEIVLKAGKHYPWMISNQNLFAHVGLSVQLQVPRNLPHWDTVLSSSQIGAFRIITQCPSNSQFTLEKTSRIPWCQKLLFSFCYPYCIFFSNPIAYQRLTLASHCIFLPINSLGTSKFEHCHERQ